MVLACHKPGQPLQGHLGGRAMPWSAEETLDGHYQKMEIHVHARTAHKSLLRKRLEEDLC